MKISLNTLILSTLILCATSLSLPAIAGETGTALKADSLKAEPYSDAKTTGTLTKNETLAIINKKGAWLQVKTKKNTGWVRLLSVKRTSTSGSLKGAMDVASGRAGTGKVVSSTGIRGLSAEELKTAKFNESEMKTLEGYATSQKNAAKFAKAGGLSATKVAYLKGTK